MCSGTQANTGFTLASLEVLLMDDKTGIPAIVDSLMRAALSTGPSAPLQHIMDSAANGTNIDWATVLSSLLTTPSGDAAAGALSELLSVVSTWLMTPVAAAPAPGPASSEDIAALVDSIVAALTANSSSAGNIKALVDDLMSALGVGGASSGADFGSVLNQLVDAVTGGSSSPLAGTDITGLIPVLQAIIADPTARGQLPALLESIIKGASPDLSSLGPLLSAITSSPAAAAQLPSLIGLLGKLKINIGK